MSKTPRISRNQAKGINTARGASLPTSNNNNSVPAPVPSLNLTETELSEFRDIFNLVDRDGGGTICKEELGDLLFTLGIKARPEEINAMIQEIDANGDHNIDFDEFVAVMSRKINTTYTAEQVTAAFGVFEAHTHPGYIRTDTLITSLMTYGSNQLTEEQARELVSQLEADENGLVNFNEYVEMMMS